ncbi:hypothetical protein M1D69_01275 [Bacillus sp. PK3-037]|uniref:hypothetical protein n=1 Tax=Bacillus halotolerans TaxID=260554 RepID=UPI00192C75DB|nr:hypothetical protein [Bacillus halotolerans]MBL4966687.1 hypothetical protein [Bacillus halotolerans]MBL4970721.1 hypothetical protein [Bacillus halotolerans]MBV5121640.1 hypothetical protein [Bacillus halotolerans]MCC2115800.1 hypothetical protein [Bacillus halotolerans]MCR6595526.1 hypothetical protein [Bacillus halotolerans]
MNEKQLAEAYERDENMMILVFAQWCVNHDLDPLELYAKAYPQQKLNESLKKTVEELIVPKNESEHIPDQTVIAVLEMFGNIDLAQAVHEVIAGRN